MIDTKYLIALSFAILILVLNVFYWNWRNAECEMSNHYLQMILEEKETTIK